MQEILHSRYTHVIIIFRALETRQDILIKLLSIRQEKIKCMWQDKKWTDNNLGYIEADDVFVISTHSLFISSICAYDTVLHFRSIVLI